MFVYLQQAKLLMMAVRLKNKVSEIGVLPICHQENFLLRLVARVAMGFFIT